MKVSLKWLQKYFDQPLPSAETVADAFTFHAFEIDEVQGDLLDVKVLPNRAADCLSHRGLAKELGAILNVSLKSDPLRDSSRLPEDGPRGVLTVEIEDSKKCLRYIGALVQGVKIGPSPKWLTEALEAVGQRSINNIVDATNYVMLNTGQPLHAFDAGKLMQKEGKYSIGVRFAKDGEKITTLSGEEYALPASVLLITDAHANTAIGIAGVKGGKVAELTHDTTDIIVESANFDGTTIRRSAQALRLFTDASVRFQNRPSPELVAYGMRDVLALITEIAGGDVIDIVDAYPTRPVVAPVAVSLGRINGLLGSNFLMAEVIDVFRRLGLEHHVEDDVFIVVPPFERTDLVIAEDLVEEVGRIIGYDHIAPQELQAPATMPDQARYRGIERMKDQLVEQGFVEISTQSFAKKGDVYLANPLDKNMPALRTNLEDNLKDALIRAKSSAPLVLAPNQKLKLFEVGTVFPKEGEFVELRMTETVSAWGENFPTFDNLSVAKLEDYGKDYTPVRYELGAYQPFSLYPFIARDIALWVPGGIGAESIEKTIRENAGELLVRLDQFDSFEKEGRVSYAFRLIFQSFERTLTDDEINSIMTTITAALTAKGYEVR
jgi:phenylalanyl-tRNA synthetase beta chain